VGGTPKSSRARNAAHGFRVKIGESGDYFEGPTLSERTQRLWGREERREANGNENGTRGEMIGLTFARCSQ
jgi:hypothetical protein